MRKLDPTEVERAIRAAQEYTRSEAARTGNVNAAVASGNNHLLGALAGILGVDLPSVAMWAAAEDGLKTYGLRD